jgi:hypothetical protein
MTRSGSPALAFGVGLTPPHHKKKNYLVMKQFTEPWIWMDSLHK